MTEVAWHEYGNSAAMAEAVANDVGAVIESALEARGQALIALPGGTSPRPIFERLSDARIGWNRVTIIPTDDRLVPTDSPMSNVAMIAGYFSPTGARVLPIAVDGVTDYRMAGEAADGRLAELSWPPDLVLLGVGADGHTASIFAGPDFDAALDAPKTRKALGVMPDPLPPEAPVARVTLSRAAILAARSLLLALSGKEKRAVVERALADGSHSASPIGRVLAGAENSIDVYWSPT